MAKTCIENTSAEMARHHQKFEKKFAKKIKVGLVGWVGGCQTAILFLVGLCGDIGKQFTKIWPILNIWNCTTYDGGFGIHEHLV